MEKSILCFGELLLRFSPILSGAWIRTKAMDFSLGGSELNTARALAKWGMAVDYLTALPDNILTKELISFLKESKIGIDSIHIAGERIGSYYLPQGNELKDAGVIYDRAHSSFSVLKPGLINWDKVFEQVRWFHFSAISAALNEDVAALCLEAVKAASVRKITVSCDLNYRSKLWQYGKQPLEVMPPLMQYCDLIMGNIWSIEKMIAITTEKNLGRAKEELLQQAETTSLEMLKRYPNCRKIANTFRLEDKGGEVRYYATLHDRSQLWVSKEFVADRVVDKVGSGDCFMAALIYGTVQGLTSKDLIQLAAAAAFDKLFIKGDATTSSIEKIKKSYLNYA
ncbi:MAG: sugar kinase [Flavisolibacter sp.]